jgi:hypothetical protein
LKNLRKIVVRNVETGGKLFDRDHGVTRLRCQMKNCLKCVLTLPTEDDSHRYNQTILSEITWVRVQCQVFFLGLGNSTAAPPLSHVYRLSIWNCPRPHLP